MSSKNHFARSIRQKGHDIAVDLSDIRQIVTDAVGEKFQSMKEGAGNALVSLKDNATSMARSTGEKANDIVRKSPWKAMAGAAAAGALAVWFFRRS